MSPGLVLSALILLLAVAYLFRRRLLAAAGAFLVVAETGRRCDLIVLLNGNISTRSYRAAELYREHRAPVVLARLADTEEVRLGVIPNISDATRDLLIRLGVAPSDITVLSSSRWVGGSWDEAILVCAHMREHGYRRAAIVTDAFHTRRARWAFRRVMADESAEFFCVPTRYSLSVMDRWWRTEYGLVQVIVEYIKFVHYRRIGHAARGRPAPTEADLPPADEARRLIAGADPRDATRSVNGGRSDNVDETRYRRN